jgi:type I restriction-modification system DNA methylase subunit
MTLDSTGDRLWIDDEN